MAGAPVDKVEASLGLQLGQHEWLPGGGWAGSGGPLGQLGALLDPRLATKTHKTCPPCLNTHMKCHTVPRMKTHTQTQDGHTLVHNNCQTPWQTRPHTHTEETAVRWQMDTRPATDPTTSSSVQFSSIVQSCPTLCDPMDCSTPGLPVHHQLPEFTQTHVH